MNFVIEYKNIQQFCRICFELKPNLVSYYTQLFIGTSSCTVQEILQLLSLEEEDENYPTSICSECKELVIAMFILKIKYAKTTEYLRSYITPLSTKKEATPQIKDDIEVYDSSGLDNSDNENKIAKEIKVNIAVADETTKTAKTFQTSTNNRKLNLHSERHVYICPICPEEFKNPLDLRQHAHTHKTLQSYLKGKKVPGNSKFIARRSKAVSNRPEIMIYQCPTCNQNLALKNFFSHIETHKTQGTFNCVKCERIFRRPNHLNIHRIRVHLEEYPFKCGICKKGFVIKKNYDCHLLTHSEKEYPHKCEHCQKRFSNPEHLYRHLFIHTENITYNLKYKVNRCHFCKNSYNNMDELKEHRRNCKFRNKTKRNINRIDNHNDTKNFSCSLCPKSYRDVGALDIHTRMKHGKNGDSKNLCSVCGKSVSNLYIHMASHTNYKPFKCNLCPKAFTTRTVLNQHLLVHSGEKPFVCSGCGKKFNNCYNLQVHERIHKGVKPHLCVICDKAFLEKSYLKKHMRIHRNV